MNRKRILVVDDDQDVRALLSLYLERYGYEVLLATDGLTCMMRAQKERPDLIVLDLGLPAGDGISALQRLRKVSALTNTPVLVLSARDAATWEPRALADGANAYMEKPVDPGRLKGAIEELLGPTPALPREQAGSGAACPHCGGTLEAMPLTLDAASIEALAQALRHAVGA